MGFSTSAGPQFILSFTQEFDFSLGKVVETDRPRCLCATIHAMLTFLPKLFCGVKNEERMIETSSPLCFFYNRSHFVPLSRK